MEICSFSYFISFFFSLNKFSIVPTASIVVLFVLSCCDCTKSAHSAPNDSLCEFMWMVSFDELMTEKANNSIFHIKRVALLQLNGFKPKAKCIFNIFNFVALNSMNFSWYDTRQKISIAFFSIAFFLHEIHSAPSIFIE